MLVQYIRQEYPSGSYNIMPIPAELESIPEYASLVPAILKFGGFERCAEMFGFVYKPQEAEKEVE